MLPLVATVTVASKAVYDLDAEWRSEILSLIYNGMQSFWMKFCERKKLLSDVYVVLVLTVIIILWFFFIFTYCRIPFYKRKKGIRASIRVSTFWLVCHFHLWDQLIFPMKRNLKRIQFPEMLALKIRSVAAFMKCMTIFQWMADIFSFAHSRILNKFPGKRSPPQLNKNNANLFLESS